MAPPPKRAVRCVIYTRKSTEHGLEQDFNSLDAQREASEAYIKSQAHEGWRLLPQKYDDGGISGGTLERPALQKILEEVRARKIDVIVVYKVDRLTRSLADFAKLVELFDAHDVSFVSVTQQFNTTTSMGRLTLNVLLSFAQFEREVTAERIRDKIAASKQKGIWVGGPVPLGYAVKEKKLVIDPIEAEKVRYIFRHYLKVKSVTALRDHLCKRDIRTKVRKLATGRTVGGNHFWKAPLAAMLNNRTYVGELVHKGIYYPGQHPALLDRKLFEAVQKKLVAATHEYKNAREASDSILIGRLFDDAGYRMTPAASHKAKTRRYRYYVSVPLHHRQKEKAGSVGRVSGPDVENAILTALREIWRKREGAKPSNPDDRALIAAFLERAVVMPGKIEITVKGQGGDKRDDEVIAIPFVIPSYKPKRETLAPDNDKEYEGKHMRPSKRRRLLRAIAQARAWADDLIEGRAADTAAIARREGVSERHVRMRLMLAWVSPDSVKAAIDNALPAGLGSSRMANTLPMLWAALT